MNPVGIVSRWHGKKSVVLSFGFLQVKIRAGFRAEVKVFYHIIAIYSIAGKDIVLPYARWVQGFPNCSEPTALVYTIP